MTTYSETQVLTYEQVLDELRAIVAEKGADYTYPKVDVADGDYGVKQGQCVYFDPKDGAPSCIVGHWFALHDVDLSDEDEGLYGDLNTGMNVTEIFKENDWVVPFTVDGNALTLLEVVQRQQDLGDPWGDALQLAVAWVERKEGNPWMP